MNTRLLLRDFLSAQQKIRGPPPIYVSICRAVNAILITLMDVLPIELWYNISELLDLGTLFSLYEILQNNHLRHFISSRVPDKLYTLLIEGRREWKLSLRTSEAFEFSRKAKGETEIAKQCDYGSSLVTDDRLSSKVNLEGDGKLDFEFCQPSYAPLATRNGQRWRERHLSRNPPPPLICLKEYTVSDSKELVHGVTSVELRLSGTGKQEPRVILRYQRINESATWGDFSDTCTSLLGIQGIESKDGLRCWIHQSLPKNWFEEVGVHILQVQVSCRSRGREDNYARAGSKTMDAIEFGAWPGLKEEDPGFLLQKLKFSFIDVLPQKRKQFKQGGNEDTGAENEIWGDEYWR